MSQRRVLGVVEGPERPASVDVCQVLDVTGCNSGQDALMLSGRSGVGRQCRAEDSAAAGLAR